MTQPFLITGLPRSRTAWFSVLAAATQDGVCCHEPTQHGQWEDVCAGVWNFSSAKFMGISDSALGFNLHEILMEYQPRTLVIVRQIEEVKKSLAKLEVTGVGNYLELLSSRLLGAVLRWPDLVKTVDYNKLNDLETIVDCLDWLMPGGVGHLQAAQFLMPLNITKKIDWPAAHAADLGAIMGDDAHAALRAN